MNHLLIEIGIHDLSEDYIGTTKRMILEVIMIILMGMISLILLR